MEINGSTATQTWAHALEDVLQYGRLTHPRGFKCFELLNCHLTTQMQQPIVTMAARNIGYRFMFAEAAWILSGDNRVKTIQPYSKLISKFSDNGETFFGAYGPKILDQLDYVCRTLANDHWSRQAVINIWRENPPKTKDTPCTISVQFIIRDGQLHCIDTMRSSDVWLGVPYDTFNFSMLSAYIILRLNYDHKIKLVLGKLFMNLGSLHIYQQDILNAEYCLEPQNIYEPKFMYQSLEPTIDWVHCEDLVDHLWAIAEQRPDDLKAQWCYDIATGIHNK